MVQSYLERVLGMGYLTAQSSMQLRIRVTLALGVVFFAGPLFTAVDLLTLRPAKQRA